MQLLKKTLINRNFVPLFIITFFAVLAARFLIFQSGYFNMHDDLQMMRQFELEKCISDGQIPCRWVPDMGYGFGFPLFNFYPPLPYLVGEIFRIIGFSFVETAKLTFALAFLLSGITMYFLSKEFFGRVGGMLSSIFYIWAPYHSVDIYVRGAMNEAWALVWFPLIFLSSYKLLKNDEGSSKRSNVKWVITLALSYAALFLSHNLMVMIFTPFFAIWVLIHLVKFGSWKKIPSLLVSGLWGLGISAFFTFPALLENKFTQVKGQLVGYYDYTVHFATIKQLLFSRFWGYGASVWLEEDRMSFQIGHLHWILSIIIAVLLIIRFYKGKGSVINRFKNDNLLLASSFLFFMGWFAAFMTHSKSTFIYLAFPALGYVQFSWRFLTLVIFAFSFLAGYLPGVFANWKLNKGLFSKLVATPPQLLIFFLLSIFLVVLDWNYFKPEYGKMGPLTDEQKFSGKAWSLQQTAGIYDYLPSTAKEAPKEPQKVLAEIIEGKGDPSGMEQGTYWAKVNTNIDTQDAKLRINILNFPGWKAFIDGKEVEIFIPQEEKWGRIHIDVPAGQHLVYLQFFNTPIRTWSNLISLFSIITLIFILVIRKTNLTGKVTKLTS